jgi:DMSO/TMAO reductase YedYZ molybdopterin-dependent catalytic subunit
MPRILHRVIASLLVAALLGQASAQAPGRVTTTLTVKGNVARELTLSVEELKQLPRKELEDARTVRDAASSGAGSPLVRRYAGCLLRDVLDRAQPVERSRFDLRRSIVIATASDGYRAVFSWAELYLSPIGDAALVVVERDGQPLDDSEGRIALISLGDTRPGPRHVKWLQSIELRTLAD